MAVDTACAGTGGFGFGVATVTSAVGAVDVSLTSAVAVAALVTSSVFGAAVVCECTVEAEVTAVFADASGVVLVGWEEGSGFFFFFVFLSVVAFLSVESDALSVEPDAGAAVLDEVLAPEG
jgi:hypothetical protein